MNTYRVMGDQYTDPNRRTGSPSARHHTCVIRDGQFVGTAGPLGTAGGGGAWEAGAAPEAGGGFSNKPPPTPVVPRFIKARVSDSSMNTVARMPVRRVNK